MYQLKLKIDCGQMSKVCFALLAISLIGGLSFFAYNYLKGQRIEQVTELTSPELELTCDYMKSVPRDAPFHQINLRITPPVNVDK